MAAYRRVYDSHHLQLTAKNRDQLRNHRVWANFTFFTKGEVTSQYLWPRYNRHFVGITCIMCGVKGRRLIVLFK